MLLLMFRHADYADYFSLQYDMLMLPLRAMLLSLMPPQRYADMPASTPTRYGPRRRHVTP